MNEPAIFHLDRLALSFTPKPWVFADERRAEIAAYFAALRRENPALWNGRVLLLHRQRVSEGVFSGEYLETDYASFSAWRAWGRPPTGVHDCFGAAAIVSRDGGVLLGRMAAHTFNAGRIYFPCGTPDPSDIVCSTVDLDRSVRRELKEETGLDADEFDITPGWTTVVDGALIAHIKCMRAKEDADTLCMRVRAHLAREARPELFDIQIVRGPSDLDPAMPRFVAAFFHHRFGA
jgi:8-oxo-dGTP pyrophosphatase MutT (NUDIX family)